MKKSLSHLPRRKRDELKRAVYIIREIVPDVEMIVLFGSFARGDWVEDIYMEGHITYEYKSDFDILVIVETPTTAGKISLWAKVENRIAALAPVRVKILVKTSLSGSPRCDKLFVHTPTYSVKPAFACGFGESARVRTSASGI